MNRSRKVELLYKRAKGQSTGETAQEKKELRKYKVDFKEDGFFVTKKNIGAYVDAVDDGESRTFYDWCIENGLADRRRKGSSSSEIQRRDRSESVAAMILGFFFWAYAIRGLLIGTIDAIPAFVLGGIISWRIYIQCRKRLLFTLVILPFTIGLICDIFLY